MAGFPVPLALMSRISKESQGFREAAISYKQKRSKTENFNITQNQVTPKEGLLLI
jgi:hypothetical protein